MALNEQQLIDQALQLPLERRLHLAECLFQSLEIQKPLAPKLVAEAEARLDAFYKGEAETIPAEEVLREFI